MISLNINVKINQNQIGNKVANGLDRAQFALDEQVLKDSNFYIPEREAYLKDSGVTHSRIGEGLIAWQTPYARRLYYNPQFNFSKDKNPNAQGLWFEAAKVRYKGEWERVAQAAYDGK
jgi:hypothetical protein